MKTFRKTFLCCLNIILFISPIIISTNITLVYAAEKKFQSSYFDFSFPDALNVISKTEKPESGFYSYIFASSNTKEPELQIRAIVSTKQPAPDQRLEDFQTEAIGHMSAMFMDTYGLYQYVNTPENHKVLSGRPNRLQLGDNLFSEVTLYLGNIDAAFLVTNLHNMTYAFTLISKNENEPARKNNLKMLMDSLKTLKLKSPP